MSWFVYILQCADDTLYCGVTTDLERRLVEHNTGVKGKGAKYTAVRRPVRLAFSEKCATRSDAQIREAALKKLSRSEKVRVIAATQD